MNSTGVTSNKSYNPEKDHVGLNFLGGFANEEGLEGGKLGPGYMEEGGKGNVISPQ